MTAEATTLRQQFLAGMSHAACTVSVVTTDGVAGRHGVTVSAMVSVSADTPQPTLLVCINQASPVADAVMRNGVFCVNVLREDQVHISESFAGRAGMKGAAKFDCTRWATQVTGAPRVADGLVAFDCRVTASEQVGSHFVLFGSVQDIHVGGVSAPLIYANRAYGVPQHFRARDAGGAAGAECENLALGCFQIFAPYVLPALIARLAKLHPGLVLTLIEADQARMVAALRRGEIDIALLYDFDLGEDIRLEPLAELAPYVLLPEGHPLATQASIELEDLAREPWVVLDVEPSREYFASLFEERGLEPVIAYRTAALEMVRGLVAHGLGFGLLATKPANNMSYDGRALVARPLANAVRNSRVGVATLAGRPTTAMAEEFAGHCRSYFGVSHAHAHP
jgi:flavin reductase (DIM6/NTAB) family NADH-FMN oxidoreductase RutF